MENKKRTGGDGDIHLPREIIHHIQSFLNEREAAQTSLLSKSWYNSWFTRPKLAFELESLKGIEIAKKTMQRYEDENLKIQSLKVSQLNYNLDSKDLLLAKEFITKAMKLGAVDLDISFWNRSIVLPYEVLQPKTLARLKLSGRLTVNLPPMKKGLTFSKLKTLNLFYVDIKGDLFRDLISRCPSIERLKLHLCSKDDRRLRIRLCMNDFGKLEFPKLEFLFLSFLEFGGILSSPKLWARFSCLKELVIFDNNDKEDVRICSRSLERLTIHLDGNKILDAEFDVPNLRMFELRASPLSRLDFKTCREWESDVHLTCHHSNETAHSWFSSLNQLLKALRSSRVSLSIHVFVDVEVNVSESSRGDGLASLVVVETLRLINGNEVNSVFVDNLFSICRPKRIILDCAWRNTMKKELLEVDCDKMVEEVMIVKLLEERFGKYSSLSWKTFSLEDSQHRPPFVHYKVIWNLDHSICT